MLLSLLRGQQRAPMRDLRSGGGYTPEAQQLLAQLRMNFLNPGNGRIGADALGLGQMGQYGWEGYRRNGQPVGNISMMRGDAPAMNTPASAALARLFGPGPSWGASNWLSDLMNPNNPNANDPYPNSAHNANNEGMLQGGSLLKENTGPQFHGGGAGMIDFLKGPSTLQGMDALFSGEGRGGVGGGDLMDSNFLY